MSKRSTGLVELYLGPATAKRKRQSLIGGVVVEDYNSNLHGGRVVVVQLPPKAKPVPKKVKAVAKRAVEAAAPVVSEPEFGQAHGLRAAEVNDGA